MLKLSLRGVMRLIAGNLTPEEFEKLHGWSDVKSQDQRNPFRRAVREGRMLRAVSVEDGGDRDDDWLCFEFSDPDPAASKFSVPRMAPAKK